MGETVNDFWRMIWENKLSTIVMVTKLVEGCSREKCAEYWPSATGEEMEVGPNIVVFLKEIKLFTDYEIRIMSIKNVSSEKLTTIHCQRNPNCYCDFIFHSHTGIGARLQSIPSHPLLLPRLARPWCSEIRQLPPRLPEAGPQEPSCVRGPPPGPLQCRGWAHGYVHRTGCHASTDPGGEGGERVPVCEGTAGEAVSNGANYGERGGIISWSKHRSSHASLSANT